MRHQLTMLILLASGLAFGQSQSREVAICKSTTLHLKATSPGAAQYQWFRNDTIITAATGNELPVTAEGTYKAFALNAAECISDESVHIVVSYHKPNAVNDHSDVQKNELTTINVLANDESQCAALDSATLTISTQPGHGTLTVSKGQFIFNPEKDFVGEDTFTYTITDKNGMISNQATVSLDIFHAMPVILAWFEAKKQETKSILRWRTSQEANSDYFTIERSPDSQTWSDRGKVNAALQHTSVKEYEFTDSLPEQGTNYYRLKMTDRDGTFAYSSIRSVYFPEMSWADLYPNPVSDVLSIVVRNRKVNSIRMINTGGTTVLTLPVTSSKLLIDMKNYAFGPYMFHFEQEDGAVKVFRIFHN